LPHINFKHLLTAAKCDAVTLDQRVLRYCCRGRYYYWTTYFFFVANKTLQANGQNCYFRDGNRSAVLGILLNIGFIDNTIFK
jgi:hypothetical protein